MGDGLDGGMMAVLEIYVGMNNIPMGMQKLVYV